MPHVCPRTRRNVNRPIALAQPVAHDPSRPRHCHPAAVHVRIDPAGIEVLPTLKPRG